MRITAMAYKRRREGGEVSVDLEDGTSLLLDADVAVKARLATGSDLTDEDKAAVVLESETVRARRRLVRYVALRRKTEAEARRYLVQLNYPEEAVEAAVAGAREAGYLNDADYAAAYVRTTERSGKKGPRAVRQELKARGIDRELSNAAVEPIAAPENQLQAATDLAEKKLPAILRDEGRTLKARLKLQNLLLRKGYDPDIAMEVTRKLLGEAEE